MTAQSSINVVHAIHGQQRDESTMQEALAKDTVIVEFSATLTHVACVGDGNALALTACPRHAETPTRRFRVVFHPSVVSPSYNASTQIEDDAGDSYWGWPRGISSPNDDGIRVNGTTVYPRHIVAEAARLLARTMADMLRGGASSPGAVIAPTKSGALRLQFD